ncbi:alpha/beta hydrolase [bacterium]|nr:alpha/beta hydrolase [candidate division CSSED10-310 bacterium]
MLKERSDIFGKIRNAALRIILMIMMIYTGSILVISCREDSYLYYPVKFPENWINPPSGTQYEELMVDDSSGWKIHGWWFPGADHGLTIVFAHGNAGHLAMRYGLVKFLLQLSPQPAGICIYDYPGYGKSEGYPSEDNLYRSMASVRTYLNNEINQPYSSHIVFGRSLGASVALHSALDQESAGVVMECPMLSVPRMAEEYYPFLPGLKYFSRQRFDNERKITRLHRPLMIIHGSDDRVIPVQQGRQLFHLASEPKRYVEIEAADHDNVYLIDPVKYREAWESFLILCNHEK